jgi:hypothetical protein
MLKTARSRKLRVEGWELREKNGNKKSRIAELQQRAK